LANKMESYLSFYYCPILMKKEQRELYELIHQDGQFYLDGKSVRPDKYSAATVLRFPTSAQPSNEELIQAIKKMSDPSFNSFVQYSNRPEVHVIDRSFSGPVTSLGQLDTTAWLYIVQLFHVPIKKK
jgi:hypothetical protein